MKSDLPQTIGKNEILIANGKLILKKTDQSKIRLIFFDVLIFGSIAYIHNSITVKSGNISMPEHFFGWLSILFAFTALALAGLPPQPSHCSVFSPHLAQVCRVSQCAEGYLCLK